MSNVSLSFRQLRAFVAVAEETSMTRAAARLSLTPSALSMLIRAMEDELGVKLFERTTRKLVLTEAGQGLLPVVKDVFQRLDAGVQSVLRTQQVKESVLTLATSPLMAASFVPKAMAGFRELHPAVKIRLLDAPVDTLPDLVRTGAVDMVICTASDEISDLHQELLYVDRLMLVCHRDHVLAQSKEVSWEELINEPLVLMQQGSGLRTLADRALAKWSKNLTPAHEVSHVATALGLVEAGEGVSVLPSYAIARSQPRLNTPNIVTIPIVSPVVKRRVVALARSSEALTKTAAAFIAYFKREYSAP
jgi:DNA-binding transcriptional LysR family regulator